jgi:hypothetical protein
MTLSRYIWGGLHFVVLTHWGLLLAIGAQELIRTGEWSHSASAAGTSSAGFVVYFLIAIAATCASALRALCNEWADL